MKTSFGAAAAAVTLLASQALHAQEAVQWKVSDGGNGHWYQLALMVQPASWVQGQSFAIAQGAHLATIADASENQFLANFIESNIDVPWGAGIDPEGCWIGGRNLNGEWTWCTGEAWRFAGWHQAQCIVGGGNQPDADGLARLLQIACVSDGECRWDDICIDAEADSCTRPFVLVEWSADCNADGIVDYGQCRDGSLPDYDGDNIPDCCEAGAPCVVGNYPVQWRIEDGGNGHWYQLSVLPPRRFWELVSDAEAVGGHLVTVGSAEENAFARSISLGYFVHFGAFHDAALPGYSEPSNGWRWVNGEPWNWTGWCVGQPDNAPWGGFQGQELARFGGAASACWDDAHSLAQIATIFIEATMFEWSADCNSDGVVDYGQILQGQLADTNADGIPDVCQQPTCADADIYRDFNVNGADLGILLSQWGPNTPLTESDLNGDGVVNGADLGLLLSFWGTCP